MFVLSYYIKVTDNTHISSRSETTKSPFDILERRQLSLLLEYRNIYLIDHLIEVNPFQC